MAKRKKETSAEKREIRLRKAKQQEFDIYEDSDGNFAFIAGYTSGSASYGITWEELGIEPYAPYEEIMAAYDRMEKARYKEVGLFGE